MGAFDALPGEERDLWVARWERTRETCGRCGMLRSLCSHPDKVFYPQMTVCYASMEQAAAQAKWDALGEKRGSWHDGTFTHWSKERSDSHPYHMNHGVTIWVSDVDLDPDNDFLSASVAR